MVVCPVCGKKVYTQKGKVVLHGSNEVLCYGSYMVARDCKYAGSVFYIIISWLIQKVTNIVSA